MDEADRVRDRASVEHYEPPVFGLEEPMWVAEDDVTGCVGVGRVRAEAVGNLVAVVESHGHRERGHVKLSGRVVERTWENESDSEGQTGALEWVRERLP